MATTMKMPDIQRLGVPLLVAILLLGAACDGGSGTADGRTALASTEGCFADEECVAGTYCFAGMCSMECADDADCGAGGRCSQRGACVSDVAVVRRTSNGTAAGRLILRPEPVYRLAAGEYVVAVAVDEASPGAGEEHLIRIRRSDRPGETSHLVRVDAADGTARVPLVGWSPVDDPQLTVRLTSTGGDVSFVVRAVDELRGFWAGTATDADGMFTWPVSVELHPFPDHAGWHDAAALDAVLMGRGLASLPDGVAPFGGATVERRTMQRTEDGSFTATWWLRHVGQNNAVARVQMVIEDIEQGRLVGRMLVTRFGAQRTWLPAGPETWLRRSDESPAVLSLTLDRVSGGLEHTGTSSSTWGPEGAPEMASIVSDACAAEPAASVLAARSINPATLAPGGAYVPYPTLELLLSDLRSAVAAHLSGGAPDSLACVGAWLGSGGATPEGCPTTFDEWSHNVAEGMRTGDSEWLRALTSLAGCGQWVAWTLADRAIEAEWYAPGDSGLVDAFDTVVESALQRAAPFDAGAAISGYKLRRDWWLSPAVHDGAVANLAAVRADGVRQVEDWLERVVVPHVDARRALMDGSVVSAVLMLSELGVTSDAAEEWMVAALDALTAEAHALEEYARRADLMLRSSAHRTAAHATARAYADDLVAAGFQYARARRTVTGTGAGAGPLAAAVAACEAMVDRLAIREGVMGVHDGLQLTVYRQLSPDGPNELDRRRMRAVRVLTETDVLYATTLAEVRGEEMDRALEDSAREAEEASLMVELRSICGVDRTDCDGVTCPPLLGRGRCGFEAGADGDGASLGGIAPSLAGDAALRVVAAAVALHSAEMELDNHVAYASRLAQEVALYAADSERWLAIRIDGTEQDAASMLREASRRHEARDQLERAGRGAEDAAFWLGVGAQVVGMAGAMPMGSSHGSSDVLVQLLEAGSDARRACRYEAAVGRACPGDDQAKVFVVGAVLQLGSTVATAFARARKRKASEHAANVELALQQQAIARERDAAIREATLVFEAQQAEVRAMQNRVVAMLEQGAVLELRVSTAELDLWRAQAEYERLVEHAESLVDRTERIRDAREGVLATRYDMGGRLRMAAALRSLEHYVALTREALDDYLTAVEYYAVASFPEERFRVRTARSLDELRAVLERIHDLADGCGSPRSVASFSLSLRDALFGPPSGHVDPLTGVFRGMAERFRDAGRNQPFGARHVGLFPAVDLSGAGDSSRPVMAWWTDLGQGSAFDVGCNAKIEAVQVSVVGDIGFSGVPPTVQLGYFGPASLRSCLPATSGVGAAGADDIANVPVGPQVVAVPAGVNATGAGESRTLNGYPLLAGLAVLVDARSSPGFDWSRLEDVVIDVRFSYQDRIDAGCRGY